MTSDFTGKGDDKRRLWTIVHHTLGNPDELEKFLQT